MAKAIAHITGTALRPGVSRNNRWYTKETIASAVARAQERIAAGEKPMVMLTVHPDGPIDSSRISASLTGMSLDEAGNARFTASIADTAAGRDMAALADTSDGQVPHLRNVSIRGNWLGTVRKVKGPGGGIVETGSDLELDGLEFTPAPGVSGARIDTFAWAGSDGQTETDERVLITESVEEAVMFTEEAAPEDSEDEPGEVTEAAGDTPAVSKRTSGLSGTGRVWADPGYQKDKKQRYDLSTKDKAKAAWSYINQAGNAAKYTATQLKRVKSRIKAALGKFGVTVAAEGWTVEPAAEVTEAVAEWYGSPETAGSYSITATNGPTNVSVSGYGLDPAELSVILAAACKGASAALATLDPDMGGDIDVPGAPNADTDHDTAGKGETAPEEDDPPVTESEPAPAGDQGPAPAGTTESEGSAMPETATTTEAGGTAPAGLTPDMLKVISEATAASVTAAFEARDAAKAKAKADREAAEARESAEKAAQREALVGLLESVGIKVPADGTPPAAEGTTETADGGKALTEADVEKRVDIAVSEALVEFKQALMTSGAILPARAGLVVREHAIPDADNAPDTEALQKMSDDDLMSYMGGAMAQQADLIRPVGAQA